MGRVELCGIGNKSIICLHVLFYSCSYTPKILKIALVKAVQLIKFD